MPDFSQTLMIAEEAAEYLRIEKSTLYNWVHQKKIPYRKHGRLLVFSRVELQNWSRRRAVETVQVRDFGDFLESDGYNGSLDYDSLKLEERVKG